MYIKTHAQWTFFSSQYDNVSLQATWGQLESNGVLGVN